MWPCSGHPVVAGGRMGLELGEEEEGLGGQGGLPRQSGGRGRPEGRGRRGQAGQGQGRTDSEVTSLESRKEKVQVGASGSRRDPGRRSEGPIRGLRAPGGEVAGGGCI